MLALRMGPNGTPRRARAASLAALLVGLLASGTASAQAAPQPASEPAEDAAEAAERPFVKSVVAPEQEMLDDGQSQEHAFPVTVAGGVDWKAVRAAISAVRVGQRPDAGLISAFTPTTKDRSGAPELGIVVDASRVSLPRTYEVEVLLTGKRAGRDALQRISVKLIHPAGQIRQPRQIVLLRTRTPLSKSVVDLPTTFDVDESSGRSRLSGLAVRELERPTRDGDPIAGTLTFKLADNVAPGRSTPVTVVPDGDYPVGTSKGRIEVRADQLDQPIVVDYEFRVRAPSWLIPFMFSTGLLLGYLLRFGLKKKEERDDRRLRAHDARERLEELLLDVPDEEKQGLKGAVEELGKGASDGLEAAITRAKSLADEVAERRRNKLRDLMATAANDAAVLAMGWDLPTEIALEPLANALSDMRDRAAALSLRSASSASEVVAREKRALAVRARGWAERVQRALRDLESVTSATVKGDLQRARDAAAAILALDATGTIDLQVLLSRAFDANSASLGDAQRVSDTQAALAEDAAARAGTAERAEAIRRAAQLPADFERLEAIAALGALSAAARSLGKTVGDTLSAILGASSQSEDDQKELDDLVRQLRYGEALAFAQRLVKKPGRPTRISSVTPNEEVPSEGVAGTERPRAASVREPRVSRAPGVPILDAGPTRRQHLERALRNTRVLRTALVGAVSAALVWAGYDDGFIGTTRELVSLFALGFTTDLTVDSLLAAFEKRRA